MSNTQAGQALLAEAESVCFESETSTLLRDAMRDYEAQQQAPRQNNRGGPEDIWSVLANQVVGHESF